jgi:hypothetical protein
MSRSSTAICQPELREHQLAKERQCGPGPRVLYLLEPRKQVIPAPTRVIEGLPRIVVRVGSTRPDEAVQYAAPTHDSPSTVRSGEIVQKDLWDRRKIPIVRGMEIIADQAGDHDSRALVITVAHVRLVLHDSEGERAGGTHISPASSSSTVADMNPHQQELRPGWLGGEGA